MDTIDRKVLDFFQKFCDYSQLNWKRNCYGWALMFTHFYGVWSLFNAYYAYTIFVLPGAMTAPLGLILIVLNILIAVMQYRRLPLLTRLSKSNSPQVNWVYILSGANVRLPILVLGLIGIIIHEPLIGIVFIWGSIYYFMSCIPRPPKPWTSALPQMV